MILKVNGLDVTSFIASGGYKWTLNDLDNKYAGRTLDGVMHRGRVGQKVKLEITCKKLKTHEMKLLLNAIDPEFVEATYMDPKCGGMRTATFYSNNKPATCIVQLEPGEGNEIWDSVTFPLIEK